MKRLSLLAVLLCSVPVFVRAETLNDALAYTYEHSTTINAQRTYQKATDEGVAKAKSGYRPTVKADGFVGRTHADIDYASAGDAQFDQNAVDMAVGMVQPVFSGLTTYQTVRVAENQVMAGRADLSQTEQTVLLNAITAYMDFIRDEAVLDLQINQEKVLSKHLDSYKKRFNAGDLTRTDIAQAEARLSGAKASRIAAEGQVKVSKARYIDVIGKEPVALKDVTTFADNLPKTLDEAIEIALSGNPRIKSAEFTQMATKYNVKAREGALSPSVDLRASAGRQMNNQTVDLHDYWRVTANMSVPLYQSGSEYANVRESKQLANRARILLLRARKTVRADTTSAWETYQATKSQIESIKAQIKASKTALDGVIRENNVGQRTILDVLDAEQEHLNNQVQLVRSHREEVISAYALLAAIGQLTPTGLNLDVETYDPSVYYEDVKDKWIGWGIDDE